MGDKSEENSTKESESRLKNNNNKEMIMNNQMELNNDNRLHLIQRMVSFAVVLVVVFGSFFLIIGERNGGDMESSALTLAIISMVFITLAMATYLVLPAWMKVQYKENDMNSESENNFMLFKENRIKLIQRLITFGVFLEVVFGSFYLIINERNGGDVESKAITIAAITMALIILAIGVYWVLPAFMFGKKEDNESGEEGEMFP